MENEKEKYRLWIEYLKRSKNYKEFCEWFREKRKKKKLLVPEKFKKNKKGHIHHIPLTFLMFRDIHVCTFDEWWNWFEKKIKQQSNQKGWSPQRIEHFNDYASFHFKWCIKDFKKLHDKEPTLNEFIDFFLSWLNTGIYPESLYLMVRVAGEDNKDLLKKFQKIITKKRKKSITKTQEVFKRRFIKPVDAKGSTKLRFDELGIYLQIHDWAENGLDIKKIIKKHNPKLDNEHPSIQRRYRGYREKAKRIIRNVERGNFPGQYEKPSPIKRKA